MNPWIAAFRPKTLTASFVPVLVSYALVPTANVFLALSALLTSLLLQTGTHFINDAFDVRNGVDRRRTGKQQRITQTGKLPFLLVWWIGIVAYLCALLAAVPLMLAGGWPIALVLLASVLVGYAYTGGPYPWSYIGLGELFAFLFFGVVVICSLEYVYRGDLTRQGVLAGVQVGLLVTIMCIINDLRDRDTDRLVNKRTLAVRFGIRFSKIMLCCVTLLPFALGLFWWFFNRPFAALLPLLLLPFALKFLQVVWKTAPGAMYHRLLAKGAAIHFLFGLLLALGLQWS